MPKRNREKLMEQSLYDLLCKMNERLNDMNHESRAYCILDLLDASFDCKDSTKCEDCIQAWMNEYPF